MFDSLETKTSECLLFKYFRSSGKGSKRRVVSDSAMRRGGAFDDEAGPRQYLFEPHEVRVPQNIITSRMYL